MKRLAWFCAWLALGCGGDDGDAKPTNVDGTIDGGGPRDRVRDDGGDAAPVTTVTPRDGGGIVADGGAPPPNETSGVEGSLVISELSAGQRERICRPLVDRYFSDAEIDADCIIEGVFETADSAACEDFARQCGTETRSSVDGDKRVALEDCTDALTGCAFTVAQLERCSKEEDAELARIARGFSCSQAGSYVESAFPAVEVSEVCQQVLDSCQ